VEHSSVGRPVVASAVGGHIDNPRPDVVTSPPACRYHVDGSRRRRRCGRDRGYIGGGSAHESQTQSCGRCS
jgi:hypothetical protein